jgi:hypothetical protein
VPLCLFPEQVSPAPGLSVDEYFKNKKNIFFLSIDNEALIGIKF